MKNCSSTNDHGRLLSRFRLFFADCVLVYEIPAIEPSAKARYLAFEMAIDTRLFVKGQLSRELSEKLFVQGKSVGFFAKLASDLRSARPAIEERWASLIATDNPACFSNVSLHLIAEKRTSR